MAPSTRDGESYVAPSANVNEVTVGENVQVLDNVELSDVVIEDSVVFSGAEIADCNIRGSIIGKGTHVESLNFSEAIIGAHTRLGESS